MRNTANRRFSKHLMLEPKLVILLVSVLYRHREIKITVFGCAVCGVQLAS